MVQLSLFIRLRGWFGRRFAEIRFFKQFGHLSMRERAIFALLSPLIAEQVSNLYILLVAFEKHCLTMNIQKGL